MTDRPSIAVVIPALNEAQSIGAVLDAVPTWVDRVVVADNGSTDQMASIARSRGAHVVHEPRRGYGAACLRGLAALNRPDIVVFLDADFSDHPEEMGRLVQPILNDEADLVIGSRVLGHAAAGSLTWPQRIGNALAGSLIRRIWKVDCTDLGPFRAIRFEALERLAMDDLDYGWTAQMQARAARSRLRTAEVPVSYRPRLGHSKISGTIRGVAGAGIKILSIIAREAIRRQPASARHRLIIFTRLPVPGHAKTRLIPELGPQAAADLQSQMTRHTLNVARWWRARSEANAEIEVRYTGGTVGEMREQFGDDMQYVEQGGGTLGQRLARAMKDGLSTPDQTVVTIGSDCPQISAGILRQAFTAMTHADAVIGPATDGGYYLIGLRKPQPTLFERIDWGSDRVLEQTMRAADSAGINVATLEQLNDIDEPDDLRRWHAAQDRHHEAEPPPELSVIIPARNESEYLGECLDSIGDHTDVEVIVVDGGSDDGTLAIAQQHGVRILRSPPGRAAQMNAGAAAARGDILLFLHADTRLPFGYRAAIGRVLSRPHIVAGAFRLALDHVSPSLRAIEVGANVRSTLGQRPYGDQAIFLPRRLFEQIDGYPNWPVMEEYALISRLRVIGRIGIASIAVITAARRWREHGAWRTTIRNQIAVASYRCRRSPDAIARQLGRSPASQTTDRLAHPERARPTPSSDSA